MKMKGRDYTTPATEVQQPLLSDPGSHVGPPAGKRKTRRCPSRVTVPSWSPGANGSFSCEEARGHSGSHYGISDSGEYDMSWNGPDELKDGSYN